MGQKLKDLDPTVSLVHYLGAEIRRRRSGRGMTLQDLAVRVMHSPDLVRKVEAADRFPSREFVALCDEALDAGGALARMWPLAQREYRLRPARARVVRSGGARFDAERAQRTVLDWLISPPRPSRATVDHEGAAAEVLDRLRSVDRSRGAGRTYPQVAAHLRDGFGDLVARVPRVAAGYLELAGYELVDLGADGHAQEHYLRALRIAADAGERCYGGYLVGVSLAHLALHAQQAAEAERFASAALHGVAGAASPGLLAALHVVMARARARQRDEGGATLALTAAETALSRSVPADEPAWIRYFGEADLADETAHCLLDVGRNEAAGREAAGAVRLLSPSRVRRLAIDTALRATALARGGDVDGACSAGREAVDYAARTTSYRSVQRVAVMLAHLQPHSAAPVVQELIDYAGALPEPPSLN